MTEPIVQTHSGIWVVRDDLHLGGTKARFIGQAFDGVQESTIRKRLAALWRKLRREEPV